MQRLCQSGLIRPKTLYPFLFKQINTAADNVKFMLTAELSMGQMVHDVRLAVNGKVSVYFYGRAGGMIFEPKEISDAIKSHPEMLEVNQKAFTLPYHS